MFKAMTTVEFCEKSLKKSSYDSSIYSHGAYSNICTVLGPNPVLWLLPCSFPEGDGLTWTPSKGSADSKGRGSVSEEALGMSGARGSMSEASGARGSMSQASGASGPMSQ